MDLGVANRPRASRALLVKQPIQAVGGNRDRQRVTIERGTPSLTAISVFFRPSAAPGTIRERNATDWALSRGRAKPFEAARRRDPGTCRALRQRDTVAWAMPNSQAISPAQPVG